MYVLKNYKNLLKSLGVFVLLMMMGCGGGNPVLPNLDPNPNPNPTPNPHKSYFKYDRISIAGSSITHGNIEDIGNEGEGYLGELSYVGEVEKYFREKVADTIGPDQLTDSDSSYDDLMSYQGKIRVFKSGAEITASLKASDEITIVYAGSDVHTVVELEVDGKVYPDYTIPVGIYSPAKKTYDDTNVNFYKAFRETNEKAVKTWKLDSDKAHTFTLRVKEGELHLNFITNHMYYMQNAGVGGFETSDFLAGRVHSTVKEIIAFNPDLFIFESGTNDAKTWATEIGLKNGTSDDAQSTNRWIVDDPINFSSSGKSITIGQNVTVQKGDVVIMGNYDGDIQNMVVGIVSQDINGKTIPLSKIISYSGKVAHEVDSVPQNITKICRIKNISLWEDRVKELVRRLKTGLTHDVAVGIGVAGVPNYYKPGSHAPESQAPFTPRRLLGYREKGQILAHEKGWFFVDFFQKTLEVEPGVDVDHKWTFGDNTHPNAAGRIYFGQAIIDVLKSSS